MGNRLAQHPVKTIELMAEPEAKVDEEEDIAGDEAEVQGIEDGQDEIDSIAPGAEEKTETKAPLGEVEKPIEAPVEQPAKPVEPPKKSIDLEITNPNEINNPGDLGKDDKGQLGLFG